MDRTISIIIPAYNEAGRIGKCLDSIARQSVQPLEILIGIDNCESTLKEVEKHVSSTIKAFFFDRQIGCYVIRNTLAMLAKGDVLMFFDADDIMHENYIETMFGLCDQGVVAKPCFYDVGHDYRKDRGKTPAEGVFAINKKDFVFCSGFDNWMFGADSEFHNRAKLHGLSMVATDRPIFDRTVHDDSLSHNAKSGMHTEARMRKREEVTRRRKMKFSKSSIPVACYPTIEIDGEK